MLQINFGESDYRIEESYPILNYPITLQLMANQNPVTLTLTPVTVDTAETMGLGLFIDPYSFPGFRAAAGISANALLDLALNVIV